MYTFTHIYVDIQTWPYIIYTICIKPICKLSKSHDQWMNIAPCIYELRQVIPRVHVPSFVNKDKNKNISKKKNLQQKKSFELKVSFNSLALK